MCLVVLKSSLVWQIKKTSKFPLWFGNIGEKWLLCVLLGQRPARVSAVAARWHQMRAAGGESTEVFAELGLTLFFSSKGECELASRGTSTEIAKLF